MEASYVSLDGDRAHSLNAPHDQTAADAIQAAAAAAAVASPPAADAAASASAPADAGGRAAADAKPLLVGADSAAASHSSVTLSFSAAGGSGADRSSSVDGGHGASQRVHSTSVASGLSSHSSHAAVAAAAAGAGSGRATGAPVQVRRWRKWAARNFICCDGRCMLGASPGGFLCTCFLVIPPFALHIPYIAMYFHPAITAAACVLFVSTVYALFRCAFTEPGIIPRNTSGLVPPAPMGEAGEDETGQKLRFCDTCQIWRPRRVKHCRWCDACIEAFDHHCPWMGNCIGLRNYPHFVRFVTSVNALTVMLCSLAVVQLVQAARRDTTDDGTLNQLSRAMGHYPVVMAMFVYTLFIWLTVVGLLHYHCDLVCAALTTNEKIKEKYAARGSAPGVRNPYDLGCWRNWSRLCCDPTPPSRVPDLHELVDT